jgi:hypothetical protein
LRRSHLAISLALLLRLNGAHAQTATLDPARDHPLTAPEHFALPEQYVWTAGDATALRPDHGKFPWDRPELRIEPHYFRAHFHLDALPPQATLYLAGPRQARVYLNGKLMGTFSTNIDQPINFRVFHVDCAAALRRGDNVLALEVVRGRGVVTNAVPRSTEQLAYGEVVTATLLAGRFGDEHAPSLLHSDTSWRSTVTPQPGWQQSNLPDASWPHVDTLGGVESNLNFFQWSVDAGMYGWPGYRGMSSFLRNYVLPPASVTHIYPGAATLSDPQALTRADGPGLTVTLQQPTPTDAEAPSILLDFGREIAGRLLVVSDADSDAQLSIAYGESELEALATGISSEQRGGNYLGTNLLDVPAHGTARGPKSGFRYVRIRILRGGSTLHLRSIQAEGITYPVQYVGSFESSDPLLNRIWETGAYTTRLCMQDDIWDAPKRDRGRWAGDLDIEGRTIQSAFGDSFLLEDTLEHLAEEATPHHIVNGIPGYTARWITTLATLYNDTADTAFVHQQHAHLLEQLQVMDDILDPASGLPRKEIHTWEFVDWAPELYGSAEPSRVGTALGFLLAYQQAPSLLRAAGDDAAAAHYQQVATTLRSTLQQTLLHAPTPELGTTWQLNTLAVLTGLDPSRNDAIWSQVLSHVQQEAPSDQQISPYFNGYVLDAMTATGHADSALAWLRTFWGGMLSEGATSFWEAYDLRWPQKDPHLSLQADGTSGYYVSLAHGWSTAPTSWLSSNVLGVTASAPGFAAVEVRPRLFDLSYARGSIPTPHGAIRISVDKTQGLQLDLPPGVESARVFVPTQNGLAGETSVTLTHSGHYSWPLRD